MKTAAISPRLISVRDCPAQDALVGSAVPVGRMSASTEASGQNPRLTPRQLQVLALLCEGLPNKLICRRLGISAGTVKAHISSILRELGVASRLQAVVAARRAGLLDGNAATLGDIDAPNADRRDTAATVTTVDFNRRALYRAASVQRAT